jgi:FSR family fosmidomycin resistance protein-like MFS transporter
LGLVLAGAVAGTGAGAPAVAAGARSRPVGAAAEPVPVRGLLVGVLALLLVSIAIRSLVGLSAARGYPASTWLLAGIPAVAFLGKSLGGLLADRIGWIETVGAALLISAVLLAVPGPGPLPLLAGLLCFQMTMPVTLVAVGRLMPTRPATAFGWTCLALAAGAAPTVFGGVGALVVKPMLVGWILIATTAVVAGLHASGVRPRRTLARVGSRGAVTTSR